jgi:hypothetical protein
MPVFRNISPKNRTTEKELLIPKFVNFQGFSPKGIYAVRFPNHSALVAQADPATIIATKGRTRNKQTISTEANDERTSWMDGWMIYSWIALSTVMYGGYSLLQLLDKANAMMPFRLTCFRAGHAHAGVLLSMSLLYYTSRSYSFQPPPRAL